MSSRAAGPQLLEGLDWDTQFFGLRIGVVHLDLATEGSLKQALQEARQHDIECLYLRLAPDDADSLALPEQFGFRLMEVQMDLARPVDIPASPPGDPTLSVRPGAVADVTRLEMILEPLVSWSRFSVDQRFGSGAARRMYRTWLARAASASDELLAVAERNGLPVGMITCDCRNVPRIGLLGVSESGRGVGAKLVNVALKWASSRGSQLLVRTQARNVGALRFYQSAGFKMESVEYLYHCWLDEVVERR